MVYRRFHRVLETFGADGAVTADAFRFTVLDRTGGKPELGLATSAESLSPPILTC